MGCWKIHADQYACVGCSYRSWKALLLGVGLVCLLLLVLGTLEKQDGHVMTRSAAVLDARRSFVVENMKLRVVVDEDEKKPNEEDGDHYMSRYHPASPPGPGKDRVGINYMSKRRVPNGADPIHNRRAGKSRRPPSKT